MPQLMQSQEELIYRTAPKKQYINNFQNNQSSYYYNNNNNMNINMTPPDQQI